MDTISSSPIKVAIIGFGQYAMSNYLDSLMNKKETLLIGICDLESQRDHFFKKLPKIPFFTDFDELLNTLFFDSIIISTPHNFHFTYAIKGLKEGKHIFTDKPLSLSQTEAKKLIITSQQKKSILLSGVPKRYSVVTKAIKDIIHSGQLGEILSLDFTYYRPRYKGFEKSWRNTPEGKGGVIFDAGYQFIDVLLSLAKEPIHSITCQASNRGFQVETVAKIGVKFKDSSTIAVVNLGLHAPNGVVFESIVIQGSKGSVNYKRIKKGGAEVKREFHLITENKMLNIDSKEKENIKSKPLAHFISMVRSGQPDIDLLANDLRTIEFIERVYDEGIRKNRK